MLVVAGCSGSGSGLGRSDLSQLSRETVVVVRVLRQPPAPPYNREVDDSSSWYKKECFALLVYNRVIFYCCDVLFSIDRKSA
jgi:hypothetical protein